MDIFSNLLVGFAVVFRIANVDIMPGDAVFMVPLPVNVLLCLIGALIGTLIGVLPGVGPVATIAMLLPITYKLDPTGALIMLAGIYYGAQYGGSTTAILVNIPGEATSVVTTLDGHQMAKRGQGGKALAIAAIGSFIAGCFATLVIAALAKPLAQWAIQFWPADYFSLMVMGLVFAVALARGSVLKALTMVALGLLLATIGTDVDSTEQRLTFGFVELADGIEFAALAMGAIGFAEILRNLENPEKRDLVDTKVTGLMPSASDLAQSAGPIARGTLLGSVLGILPGNGAVLGPFASYTVEKRLAKDPSRFGKGAIEGVAGPEAANNAGAQTSFIPMLVLGIPPNAVMAIMIGAMILHGIAPGPRIMESQPQLFWGMVASMWVGNLMLLIINLPLIGLWVRLLKVPYRLLFPAVVLFCCIGIYSINNQPFDVLLTGVIGLSGYLLLKHGFEPAPLLIAFVLGKLMEENLRQAMITSRGTVNVFFERPLSLTFLCISAVLLILSLLPAIRRKREEVFTE
jgi:putative tricarboxylic transport membrane protein